MKLEPTTPSALPLLYSFRKVICGSGFAAGVVVRGRALLEVEDGETWVVGVAPAGHAGGGLDRASAFAEFRAGWERVLFDIASEATSFAAFRDEVTEFLRSESTPLMVDWTRARDEVRASGYRDHSLARHVSNGVDVQFNVVELVPADCNPKANQVESALEVAA